MTRRSTDGRCVRWEVKYISVRHHLAAELRGGVELLLLLLVIAL
jgi:hypothetical protein